MSDKTAPRSQIERPPSAMMTVVKPATRKNNGSRADGVKRYAITSASTTVSMK